MHFCENTATMDRSETEQASDLQAAVIKLKALLSAGLPMEQAMQVPDEAEPAYRLAVGLWFGMEA